MIRDVIYYSSYLFILAILIGLGLNKKRNAGDVMFLVGVSLLPLGKLFYMPFIGLVSVTIGFIYTTIVGSTSLLLSFIKGVDRFVFVPFIIILPALLSIVFLYPPSQSMFVSSASNASSAGSPLLRIISVFFTSIYCAYVMIYVAKYKNSYRDVATYYILATLFATFIGFLIAYSLFVGSLGPEDIIPVSVEEVHMAGRIYRFNPGASVNEFGEIIGYAIFMLRWTGWRMKWKFYAAGVLLAAEFLSLTRGAWLGLVVGYMAYAAFSSKKHRMRIFMAAGLAVVVLLLIAASSEIIRDLLITRTALVSSPGSDDRINTAAAIYDAMTGSTLRMLFGYGWAADIFSPNYGFDKIGYIHSVPLMFFFDTGLVGVTICAAVFLLVGRFIYANVKQDLDIFAGIIVFMFTVSAFEHIFFHPQTWLILGLLMGIALRASRTRNDAALIPASAQPRISQ